MNTGGNDRINHAIGNFIFLPRRKQISSPARSAWSSCTIPSNAEYKKKHVINHEYIHCQRALATGIVGFYGLFLLELIIKSIIHRSISKGYTSISFERESYLYMSDMNYLQKRKRYNWIKNIFKI